MHELIDDEASRCKIYEDSKEKIRSLQKRIAKLERKRDTKQTKLNTIGSCDTAKFTAEVERNPNSIPPFEMNSAVTPWPFALALRLKKFADLRGDIVPAVEDHLTTSVKVRERVRGLRVGRGVDRGDPRQWLARHDEQLVLRLGDAPLFHAIRRSEVLLSLIHI